MSYPLFIVDAFTDRAFSGNQAAICLLDRSVDENWMQQMASEMNLSETAFLVPEPDAATYSLRWFTPTAEVALCGHATLAAAHILWTKKYIEEKTPITFRTLSGDLIAALSSDGNIALDFPVKECFDYAPPMELLVALGCAPKSVQRNDMDVLIELSSEDEVRGVIPNFYELSQISIVRGVIITATADEANGEKYDFISRFFAPAVGIDEDPVTGSAHCALAPYWTKRLGKNPLVGYQASKRGGMMGVEVKEDRVILSGKAVTVLEGKVLAL